MRIPTGEPVVVVRLRQGRQGLVDWPRLGGEEAAQGGAVM